MMHKVSVFYKNILAGELCKTSDENFVFCYDEKYIDSDNPSISLTLPKAQKKFESDNLFPFFDGLIPEGWLLNLASKKLRLNPLRDRFELLTSLCRDTIGAVHIGDRQLIKKEKFELKDIKYKKYDRCLICYGESDQIYHVDCMMEVFGEKIIPYVDIDDQILEALANKLLNKKLTIPGVQKKLSLDLVEGSEKKFRMTMTDLWGRFIFKPRGEPPHLPENEHLCLRLAKVAQIKVEKGALIPTRTGELGFVAARFDRSHKHDEFHQEDFCQILNKESFKKYNGSLEQVGKILKQKSDFPGDNIYRLYELSIFNFIIGNVDGHLKNFSLTYEDETGAKMLLSPAYDLISTDLYIHDDNEESALAINGKKNKLEAADFLSLAKNLGITLKTHNRIMDKFQKIVPTWGKIIDKSFIEDDKKEELKKLIRKKIKRLCN